MGASGSVAAHSSRERLRRRPAAKPFLPISVAVLIALVPGPAGLPPHAWYFFAIFAGVIVGLVVEPLPGPAVSLIGVVAVILLAPWVLFDPVEYSRAGFDPASAALTWGLSGFANSTVWLVFAAFQFALGYERTGLGRRIALRLVKAMGRNTLSLGYAVAAADTLLAPFTPSSVARSAGTIFPIVRNLPPLYGSHPNDPSARKVGSFLLWTALCATSVSSSLFLTGMAPNLLGVELVRKGTTLTIGWGDWFTAFAPAGILLLLIVPLLVYVIYPPTIKQGRDVPAWAERELASMGPLSAREITLAALVVLALIVWIFGGRYAHATSVAMAVVTLMLLTGVVSWNDVAGNGQAWSTLIWFGTLVALADGLSRTGFVGWFAQGTAAQLTGFTPTAAMVTLVSVYFFSHYLFASITAHVAAMLPVTLAVGTEIPGMPMLPFATMLLLCGGLMSILTPYAAGPNPVYYGSGYLPARDFWRLGAIFGTMFLVLWLAIGVLWLVRV
jgi:L-tartrate/succinate antiporter